MKIKITLIAFFASVLVLTSCMKNEVSPGIEQVRSAYAAFLNARAQALIIDANAQAELTRAQAAVQNANAELTLAQAAGVDAQTAQALENLAQAIEMNKVALAAAQRAEQALLDAYLAGVVAANNALVNTYFTNYKTALVEANTIQKLIYDKQKAILDLNLDLINGTDLGLTNAKAALAAAEAQLAALQAELVEAQAILGDPAAITAKLAELVNDSVQLEVLIATLEIDKKNEEPNFADEAATEAAKLAAYNTAKAATVTAKANLANAEANFLADTVGTYPVPDFWKAALDSVANTNARLVAGAADTLASYNALKAAEATIAAGTTVIDARIADTLQSIADYNDSIDKYYADSLAAVATNTAKVAVFTAAQADTAAWHDELNVLTDSLSDQRARYAITPTPALLITITDNAADSTVLEARITIAENQTLPNAVADTVLSHAAMVVAAANSVAADALYTPAIATANATLGSSTIPTGLYLIRANTLAAVAAAQLALPDLQSDYLYHQTFIPDLVNAVTLAEAYKEAVRPDYETWKAEYYDAYVANLQAIVTAKETAEATAKAAWQAADAALDLAKAAWTEFDDAQTEAMADLALLKIFQGLYGNVNTINENFVLRFENAITAQEGVVAAAEAAVAAAEVVYQTGLVNYDKWNDDLAELNARLEAAKAQVEFWKALLDEAIANASN